MAWWKLNDGAEIKLEGRNSYLEEEKNSKKRRGGEKKKNPILGNADRVCTMEVSRRIPSLLVARLGLGRRERKKERKGPILEFELGPFAYRES